MRSYVQLMAYHLRGLTRFSGRDARPTFWPWAITLLVASMATFSAIMLPTMMGAIGAAFRHPRTETGSSQATATAQIEGGNLFSSMMTTLTISTAIVAVIVVALLAASVTRRLHDHGKSGAWGLLPLPFLATAMVLFPKILASTGPGATPDGLFFAGFFNNLIYLACLGYLVFLLVRDGDAGPPRFGPPPSGG